ncbi:MAG: aryl-sulfate sulfotransferase [Flavobacteriales bacterium]|nr:aryl-sulfate sulfotransferase [Flavobacteriales bacterium]
MEYIARFFWINITLRIFLTIFLLLNLCTYTLHAQNKSHNTIKLPTYNEKSIKTGKEKAQLPLFNEFEFITYLYDDTGEGDIFLTTAGPMGGNYNIIIDNYGEILYYENVADWDFKVVNGNHTVSYHSGQFRVRDSCFTPIDSFECGNGYATDPHDIAILPNGNALLICEEYRYIDMSLEVDSGDTNAYVKGGMIQEIDLISKEVVFQWSSFDHFEFTDNMHGANLTDAYFSYVHMNSIQQDTDGNIIISNRNMDEVTKINRSDSSIIWRLGGKNNDFEFTNDTSMFTTQHDAKRIENGNITIFDNSVFNDSPTRGVEYEMDEVAMTVTMVWEQKREIERAITSMGNIQRLPNGNSIFSWGSVWLEEPNVAEYEPDGTKVFELYIDGDYSNKTTYRAYRFVWRQYKTLVKNIAPETYLFTNYPNPFTATTTVLLNIPEEGNVNISITNFAGKTIKTIHNGFINKGTKEFKINLQSLASGVYFCTAISNNYSFTKKLVKQ